ncbi:MAG TPA: hypothetical protein VNG12_08825 [Acidimicrobiales bacterium]|nr:hypothetical protein [Acidimicrobiales bacterium]
MNRGTVDDLGTPYDGYIQTVARLVAEPVSLLPIKWFASCMAVVGAAIVTCCAFVVWKASASYPRSPFCGGRWRPWCDPAPDRRGGVPRQRDQLDPI